MSNQTGTAAVTAVLWGLTQTLPTAAVTALLFVVGLASDYWSTFSGPFADFNMGLFRMTTCVNSICSVTITLFVRPCLNVCVWCVSVCVRARSVAGEVRDLCALTGVDGSLQQCERG